jgi:hypothetical protein
MLRPISAEVSVARGVSQRHLRGLPRRSSRKSSPSCYALQLQEEYRDQIQQRPVEHDHMDLDDPPF